MLYNELLLNILPQHQHLYGGVSRPLCLLRNSIFPELLCARETIAIEWLDIRVGCVYVAYSISLYTHHIM